MNKTKKMMAGVATSIMALGLVGCTQNEFDTSLNNVDGTEDDYSTTSTSLPPEPTEYECDDWDWDENEGTYYCDDSRSSHFGAYYLLGTMFNNKSALHSSSNYSNHASKYQSTKSSKTNTTRPTSGGTSSNSYKSGIGSGSKGGFGG
jgi:hypothetical protein